MDLIKIKKKLKFGLGYVKYLSSGLPNSWMGTQPQIIVSREEKQLSQLMWVGPQFPIHNPISITGVISFKKYI